MAASEGDIHAQKHIDIQVMTHTVTLHTYTHDSVERSG